MNEGYGDYDSNDEKRRKRFLSTIKFFKKILLNTSFIPLPNILEISIS